MICSYDFCLATFCFSKQAAVSSTSTFNHFKGELVIALKYVTPENTTAEKTEGETLKNLCVLWASFVTRCLASTQARNQ